MSKYNNSRDDWEQEIIERQHNLAPADITRTSHFRASGLPKSAPLPIAIRRPHIYVGAVSFVLGIAVRAAFDKPGLLVVGTALGAAGLFLMLSAIRWTAKQSDNER